MKLFKAFGFNKPTIFQSAPKPAFKPIIIDNTNVSTMEMIKTGKQYPAEVQQIHHEFHTAADNLLLEAKSIIAEAATKNVTKVNHLELLGFKQASQVTELKPLQQKAELSKEQLESLAYYQREYPFNKFITEEQVKIICHKYNLVCGEVNRFKGFVPEKNLSDIEKFSLKDKDIPFYSAVCKYSGITYNLNEEDFTKYGLMHCVKESNAFFLVGNRGENIYMNNPMVTEKCIQKFSHLKSIYLQQLNNNVQSLQICAPVKDMDISDLELIEGYKLTKKHIPDPVVLQPVKNGYLIITAWGDEASDELVVNQINN